MSQDHLWLADRDDQQSHPLSERFRGYLPVVIDVETGGFNAATDALLEIAATPIDINDAGLLIPGETLDLAVLPFEGANIEQSALDFTGIDPFASHRGAIAEDEALREVFSVVRRAVKNAGCKRAIMVGHNAFFDHGFVFAAASRHDIKRNPFHPFSTFDTVTLAGMAFGQTVLAKACHIAGIEFSNKRAHAAAYDCSKTAELFCRVVNQWHDAMGWPARHGDDNDD